MSAAQMANLYRLQEVEQSLAQLKAQRENDPVVQDVTKLTDALNKYARLEQAVIKQVKAKKLAVRQAEEKLSGIQSEASDIKAKLYGGVVTNPKELAGLEARLSTLQSELGAGEHSVLESMEAVEQVSEQLAQVKAMASQLKRQLRNSEQKLIELSAEWDFVEEDLRIELEEIRNNVEPSLLEMYERRRSTTNGRPVAKVSHGVCGGCRTELPTSQRQSLGREIVSCQRCHRLLYWPT